LQQATPLPAKGVLAIRRISNRRVARLYGAHEVYIGRVLNGYERPSPRFRAFLSELLDVSESELFQDSGDLVGGGAR
jgi:transcriptional regulator with XRE-family HTH domain